MSDDSSTRGQGGVRPAKVTKTIQFTPVRSGLAADAAAAPTYTIFRSEESDEYEEHLGPQALADAVQSRVAGIGDNFAGTARKAAKLSISAAQTEDFADLKDLISSLTPDAQMVGLHISTGPDSGRVLQEERNVHVKGFIYAASMEADNDFHLIVGRAPNAADALYMTMEVSGLPDAGADSFAQLQGARNAYKQFFGANLPGAAYDFYDPPVPIEIEGSLFFDESHSTGGHPGPKSLRKNIPTIWEVHPISRIVL